MLKWSKSWEHWYRRALPAYWVYLFCVTHLPKPQLLGVSSEDKLAHIVSFGLLAFLFWKFAESFNRRLSNRFVWIALIVLAAYATLDEYLQQFVNRYTCLPDWIANLTGIVVVLLALELHRRYRSSSIDAEGLT